MVVVCPNCRKPIAIPEDKYRLPGLKGRCGACQTVFVVAEAPPAPAASSAPFKAASASVASSVAPPASVPAPRPQQPPLPSPAGAPTSVTATIPKAVGVPAAARAGAGDTAARPRRSVPHWRRCVNHPQAKSESVCPPCRRGYCKDCGKTVGTATICPECDGLCRPTVDHEAQERRALEQARSLREELPIIVRYPFVDVVAYVFLAVVVWVATVARGFALFGGGIAILFSQGLLMAYSFTAVNRVSSGNLRSFTPDISDMTALIEPLRLSLAALLISSGPLLLLLFFYPSAVPRAIRAAESAVSLPVARAQDAEETSATPKPRSETQEEEGQPAETPEAKAAQALADLERLEPSAPAWVLPLMALALLWKAVYSPIALAVAAISRSFSSTINPVVGVGCIRSMGSVYWEAMAIYSIVVVLQTALGLGFGLIPILGTLVRSFIDAYVYLAVGCTLGFAVFKKARELGME